MRKLEIGSGNHPKPGYEHCDINENCPDLDFVCSMHCLPVEDNAYDEVTSTHVIEHQTRELWLPTLKEWLRVLKPGGVMYADTPNLTRNIKLFAQNAWENDFYSLTHEEQQACSLNGRPNRSLWFNFKCFSTSAQWNVHYGNFTEELIVEMCLLAGFETAVVHAADPSLIVKATKKR